MLCIGVMVLTLIAVRGYDRDWDVRLEGGMSMNEGRLEIRPPGKEWGTVCQAPGNEDSPAYAPCNLPEYLDPCYRLGYMGTYSFSPAGERYGMVNGPIWSQGVQCPNDTTTLCWMSEWSFQQRSCDHSSDWAILCILETVRLSGGCTAREGWVEVSLGAAGWARLKHPCPGHISRTGADSVCKHLGYPMALGAGNPCKIDEPDDELPAVMTKHCVFDDYFYFFTFLEYLRLTAVLRCDDQDDAYGNSSDWELVCAYDDEVIATNVKLTDFFDIRLINGSSHLVGILELRHNESSWAPACVYDLSRRVREIPENICNELGQKWTINWKFVEPKESHGLEYVFREGTFGQVSWLGVENRCLRLGGFNFHIECSIDDEVIATNAKLTDFFDVRLINGSSHLVGILELRHNESSWAPACFSDMSGKVGGISENICNELGQNCAYNWQIVKPKESQSLEYVFREDTRGQVSWLGVENHCLRLGGFNLRIECSIDVTLHDVTVHILPNQTCRGRCGDPPTRFQCGCDFMCNIFKDCCFDIDICELPTAPEFESHPFPNLVSLLHSSEYYECLSVGSPLATYELVSICPDIWSDDMVRSNCESPGYPQPVLYSPLRITFKNIMCAYCHGVEQLPLMTPKQDEYSNATITTQPYNGGGGGMLIPVGNQGSSMPRPCANYLHSTCQNETHDLQQSCQGYKAHYSRYKNPHCALCNDVNLDSVNVCRMDIEYSSSIGISDYDKTEKRKYNSISSSLIGGVPDEIARDYHVISLDVEINCWQGHTALEVTMLNSKHENEDDLSGSDSMKCLVYAVAYSNLSLALHFSSSLRSLLDSESQVERSGGTASIISRTLSEIGDFAGMLDKVLRVDGDLTQTDWGFRCGLAKASLIHECSTQPPIANTSNTNNECIDTEEGASISMNISGELFVYVIDDGTIISPVNITTTIAYNVQTDNVGKRRVIRFCGERNNALTCKTSTDFNNMYRYSTYYVESPESKATLPNGETIVCFTKAQLDPFSGPEQIVNLICFSLSLAGLTATLITYSVFSTLRNVQGLAVMSLSLAILIAQLSSILSQVVATLSIRGLCSAFAVITHYFWLSAFAWMAAISWDFMRTFSGFTSAKSNTSLRKFRRLCLVGWGLPLLVIIPHLILHFCECTELNFSYGSEVSCWIASRQAIFIMFCVPVILCVCFNVACFGWTVRCIRSSKKASAMVKKNASSVKEAWLELLIYVKISSLMGFAWIIGFIALATNFVAFWYLFAIFSSLQGVFIFFSFAFSGRVRALWSALWLAKHKVDPPILKSSTDESRVKHSETTVI